MRLPSLLAGLLLAALVCALPHLVGFSGATLTSGSSSMATVTAAADWTPPTVALTDPGSTVSGTVTVAATAADNVAVQSVRIQVSASGTGSWTDLCTDTTSPWSCSWTTTGVGDGNYELRAIATDTSGYSTTSAVVGTQVVNTLRVVLTDPGDNLRGTVPVSARVFNAPLNASVQLEIDYAATGTGKWTTICTTLVLTSLSCSWSTPATGSYDLRAYAVVAGKTYTDTLTDIQVDNTAPSVTVANPGSTLSGVATVSATASDADSGVASVTLRTAPSGTGTWTTLCTAVVAPWSCRWDTTKAADGRYDVQAVAADVAGNTTTSSAVTVTVDNTVNSVSLDNPGAYVSGTITLSANAASSNGVASVQVQQRATGTTAFATICTTSVAPYTCSWATTGLANGSYDLRALLTDKKGNTLGSAVLTTTVDNSPLKAFDVQASNGSTIPGRIQTDDVLQLSYSATIQTTTVATGWDGSGRAVTVRLADNGTNDTLSFTGANLGTVALGQNYVKKAKTVTFAGTMTAGTTTTGGVTRSVITITLGAQTGGGTLTAPAAGTMTWTPVTAVLSTAGVACSTTPATESGAGDKDF